MANEFFQTHQNYLPYESKFIARGDMQGGKGKTTSLRPEILKGAEKSAAVTTAAAKGTLLEIIPMHIKNPPRITFMAFLDDFTDSFSPQFNSQNVYGRSDSYHVWRNSGRSISLGWKIPSSGKNMALRNLANINWFLASLYPAYKESVGGSNAVSATPLFRVKFANMIMSANYSEEGLLCTIKGVRVGHNKKAGFIIVNPGAVGEASRPAPGDDLAPISIAGSTPGSDVERFDDALGQGNRPSHLVIPSEYSIRCQLDIIHENPLGLNHETGEWRAYQSGPTADAASIAAAAAGSGGNGIIFPYGIELNKGLDESAGDDAAADPNDGASLATGDDVTLDCDGDGQTDPSCTPGASKREEDSLFLDAGGDGTLDNFQLDASTGFGSLG